MQKARRHRENTAPTACRHMVSGTISLFCSKCFSPFPHGTGSLSVSREYLALPDGPGKFTQDSSCPALLRIPLCHILLHILDYHLLWSHFPKVFCSQSVYNVAVLQPQYRLATTLVWAPPRSLATTCGIIRLFSPPTGNEMFQFPAFAPHICGIWPSTRWVAPFGNPWIKGYLLLPTAYRSLSRPSSPPRATGIRRALFLSSFFSFNSSRYSTLYSSRSRRNT